MSQICFLLAYTGDFALIGCCKNQQLSAAVLIGNDAENHLYFKFATEPFVEPSLKDHSSEIEIV